MQTIPTPTPTPAQDGGEIINFPVIKNWLSLVARSVRYRKRLVIGITLSMVVLAAGIAQVLPKNYRVTCKLLAQRNPVLALQGDTSQDGAPTKAAAELVAKRENIVALVEATSLLAEWKANRPFLFRMKDKAVGLLSKPPDEKQMKAALADYLATKIQVWNDEQTVTIQIEWRDPVLAFRLVDAAQRGFLEAKHVQEVSAVAESVSILEGHAAALRAEIDKEVTEMQALMERKKHEETTKAPEPAPSAKEAASARPPAPAAPAGPTPEQLETFERQQRRIAELGTMIETKSRMVNELDGARLRRVSDLQAKLSEQMATYTDQHPLVTEAQQQLQASQVESPQVARLKAELKQLQNEQLDLQKAAGIAPTRRGGGGGARGPAGPAGGLGDVIRIEQASADERDPEIAYARSKLQFAITNYQSLEDQIRRSRIGLDTAQAAFKYRYSMVIPPEIPKGPISPKVPLIIIAALIGGLVIGIVSAAILELHSGIMFEPWQIQHATSLPVLVTMQLGDGGRKSDTS